MVKMYKTILFYYKLAAIFQTTTRDDNKIIKYNNSYLLNISVYTQLDQTK